MESIADWLKKLSMSEYSHVFAEQGIDVAALRYLTDEDLKDIGVLLGHRRKMLAAIKEHAAATPPTPQVIAETEPEIHDTAQRRHITVMFSDLVGSTELAGRMDPEDLREVMSAYRECVAETIRRSGGFVALYLGDGLLAYFGYPHAHEDDAERAVRAGLELIAAVCELNTGTALQTRVGIATGLVVVGDLFGSGNGPERDIVGETPNLAARLQGLAQPNTVVIDEGTRRLLGGFFEFEDLGLRNLKGVDGLVPVWAALRPSVVGSRFEALRATGLTGLVGREEEADLLLRRWARAKNGEGQVVLLSGEAGIGKSRLTAALLQNLADEPHTCLRYFCSPQHTDSTLYPIIGQMERAAELTRDDIAQAKLDKLDALLRRVSTPLEDAALFAEMLSLPNDGRYPALASAPQQRRQRMLEALLSLVEALARLEPVLIVFEDVHWIDPTSMEALGLAVERIAKHRVLLIVTFRPEVQPPWIGRAHVTVLTINRLGQREVEAMIDRVVGDSVLSQGIRADIVERTDGIPLFVEEITKAVLEAKSEGAARHGIAAIPSPAVAVPASLHASLMARLDRLGHAREVAQIGAAIGREFSHELLAAVVRRPEAELGSALSRLIEAGLLFRQGMPPHATYLFKHALVRDAAYGTLLREPRRALHARIVETLQDQFAEIAERQPELLARHCTEAGLIEEAAGLWGKAGQRSLERSALVEAVAQLTQALQQIAALPMTPGLRKKEIQLQVALITPLIHLRGYSAPETKAATERAHLLIQQAESLGEAPEDPLLLFSVLFGAWSASAHAFDGNVVPGVARQFLALAEKQGATVPRMIGHRVVGITSLFMGDIVQSRVHCDRSIALYDPTKDRAQAMRFGVDAGVSVLCYRSVALWLLGYPDAALADIDRAIKDARAIGQAPTLMYALAHAPFTRFQCGDHATTVTEELVALADEKGASNWKNNGMLMRGWHSLLIGRRLDAVQLMTTGLAGLRAVGVTLFLPAYLSNLARAYAELGKFDDARCAIDEAISVVETTKEGSYAAEVHRIAGEIVLMSPEPNALKAECYFERALEIAQAQQAKAWELRTAMSMARLWRNQRKQRQAGDLLKQVYTWFTEGFDTLDLKSAKSLLDELAS
jgi:class 3 adenylate cyclase/predicted ATPase